MKFFITHVAFDFMQQDRDLILVICTGNTCRSPMAEKLLQHALAAESEPLSRLNVESAGVAARYGEPPSSNSVAALKKLDIDLASHKSQPITQEQIDQAFMILGMTDSHLDILKSHYNQNLPEHINLFRGFIGPSDTTQIPDPYGNNFDAYRECLDTMAEAIPSLIAYLKKVYT